MYFIARAVYFIHGPPVFSILVDGGGHRAAIAVVDEELLGRIIVADGGELAPVGL